MAQFQHKDVIDQLKVLGLTDHEAEIYLVLLRLGEASAGLILEEVKLYREQVYRALKKLLDEGLVTYYVKRKRGYYAPINPAVLVNRVRSVLEVAESVQPYLESLHHQKPHIIWVNEGTDALRLMLEDMANTLKTGEEYLILGGAGHTFYEQAGNFLSRYIKRFREKQITNRLISYEGQDFSQVYRFGQQEIKVKKLPITYQVPAATLIYGSKVAIQILNPNYISVITIENEDVANAYRQNFELLWQIGEEIALPNK